MASIVLTDALIDLADAPITLAEAPIGLTDAPIGCAYDSCCAMRGRVGQAGHGNAVDNCRR